MSTTFLDVMKTRRSLYGYSKEAILSDDQLVELVQEVVKHTPSAFNSQSARVVVLFGEKHDQLWSITTETLKKIVPAENFAPTQEKMDTFNSGYGTILFFEDQAVIEGLQQAFPAFAANFPGFSTQSNGMVQFAVWTALAEAGYAASLQHYNPLIDDEVKATFGLPASWNLFAQMPFGKPTYEPGDKEFQPIEDRVKVLK